MVVLVTGATGYIGGRLVPRLLEAGHDVRVIARDANRVRGRDWADRVDIRQGDLLEPDTLAPALKGVEVAYYLVHSMHAGGDFAAQDRTAARNFLEAGGDLDHVIYLGGLQPEEDPRSEHLASRAEVGAILRESVPTTEFRAGPIVGSGSGSFEMLRYLTERLPVMVAPKWVDNPVQPIGVADVLTYLVLAASRSPAGIVAVGSPDVVTFREMMLTYADVRGLKRRVLSVPVLTPRLAGLWVGLVTPIPNRLAVPLIKGIVQPVTADTTAAEKHFPEVEPMAYRDAIETALERVETGQVETRWSGALGGGPTYEFEEQEGMVREVRTVPVDASPDATFRAFTRLGGDRGWPAWSWAWRLRGLLDRLVGGPGLRRGRRHPEDLAVGEALDLWRVESVQPGRGLRLRAEMRLPGKAWLAWQAEPEGDGTRLVQTALFAPRGLSGALYWYLSYPFHRAIFTRLARAVAKDAEELDA